MVLVFQVRVIIAQVFTTTYLQVELLQGILRKLVVTGCAVDVQGSGVQNHTHAAGTGFGIRAPQGEAPGNPHGFIIITTGAITCSTSGIQNVQQSFHQVSSLLFHPCQGGLVSGWSSQHLRTPRTRTSTHP